MSDYQNRVESLRIALIASQRTLANQRRAVTLGKRASIDANAIPNVLRDAYALTALPLLPFTELCSIVRVIGRLQGSRQ